MMKGCFTTTQLGVRCVAGLRSLRAAYSGFVALNSVVEGRATES